VLPDHELLYAAIGALDTAKVEQYRTTVTGFLKSLDQVKKALEKASTADEVDAVQTPWPTEPQPARR
jgi:hypothetical protein